MTGTGLKALGLNLFGVHSKRMRGLYSKEYPFLFKEGQCYDTNGEHLQA